MSIILLSNFSLPCHLVNVPFVPFVIHIIFGFTDTYKLIFFCQNEMYLKNKSSSKGARSHVNKCSLF